MPSQGSQNLARDHQRPSRARLRLPERERFARSSGWQGLADSDAGAVEVDVRPRKAEKLASTEAEREHDHIGGL